MALRWPFVCFSLTKGQRSKRETLLSVSAVHQESVRSSYNIALSKHGKPLGYLKLYTVFLKSMVFKPKCTQDAYQGCSVSWLDSFPPRPAQTVYFCYFTLCNARRFYSSRESLWVGKSKHNLKGKNNSYTVHCTVYVYSNIIWKKNFENTFALI